MRVHDEVVFLVPDYIRALLPTTACESAARWAEKMMCLPTKWAPTLPLDAEASYGLSFGDCK